MLFARPSSTRIARGVVDAGQVIELVALAELLVGRGLGGALHHGDAVADLLRSTFARLAANSSFGSDVEKSGGPFEPADRLCRRRPASTQGTISRATGCAS